MPLRTSPPIASSAKPRHLNVSTYDRTATLIIAALVFFGALVIALGMIFFADKFHSEPLRPIAIVPVEATSPTANGGVGTDPEPLGVEDAPELAEPQLGETLDAVSAASQFAPSVFSEEGFATVAKQAGAGSGLGDGRAPGPGSEGVIERVPRWERWKIRFEPKSTAEFAEWLDQFQIRVAVLGRDNKVHVASKFSGGAPLVEHVEPKTYSTWGQTVPADGPMPKLTNDLARQAGILQFGSIALLFYPFEVEGLLWTMEKEKNASGDPNKIRETVFTVTREGRELKFSVVDQKYF